MALTFTIGGVDKTTSVCVTTLKIDDVLNSRNTCSFELISTSGAYRPVVGASIVILNGATRIFAGSVDDFLETDLTPETGVGLYHYITCVDYNQLADRFDVAKAYSTPSQTLHDIVLDIVATYLTAEGVTTTNVATGPIIQAAVWNYLPVATAFQDLADLAGYAWWIDYNKDLHFSPRDANPAPFALTNSSANYRAMTVKRSRATYRNYQIVRAGTDLTTARTDSFAGDGKSRAWPVVYNIGKLPTAITLNGGAKTIGILGVETGKDYYWNLGSPLITQDSGGTLLISTDTVAVTYQGQFPIVVVAQLDAEITARAAVEGGTGVYQETEYYPNVNSNASAQDIAAKLLQKLGNIPVIVNFETDTDGLFSGQLIPITNTAHALSGTYLISKVSIADFTGVGNLRYKVECYDGQFLGSWESFFRYIASIGRKYVIRENEVVVYLRTAGPSTGVGATASESLAYGSTDPAYANVGASESLAVPTSMTPESRVDFALTDLSETG